MPVTLIDERVSAESLRPYQDHVVLKVLDRQRTVGGIYLPGNKATPCVMGKVISAGKEIPNNHDGRGFPIPLCSGDVILFMDYAGERARIEWEDYRILREHGIWAKVRLEDESTFEIGKIWPWADRVLLEPRDETKTRSGILYLPNQQMPLQWNIGKVVQVGFGIWHLESGKLMSCECQVGEDVLYRRYAGANVDYRGKSLRLIQEVDIMARMEE